MGSPLGLVLANLFMFELETSVIPNLSNKWNYERDFLKIHTAWLDQNT